MVDSPNAICLGSDQTLQVGEVAQQTLVTGCFDDSMCHLSLLPQTITDNTEFRLFHRVETGRARKNAPIPMLHVNSPVIIG